MKNMGAIRVHRNSWGFIGYIRHGGDCHRHSGNGCAGRGRGCLEARGGCQRCWVGHARWGRDGDCAAASRGWHTTRHWRHGIILRGVAGRRRVGHGRVTLGGRIPWGWPVAGRIAIPWGRCVTLRIALRRIASGVTLWRIARWWVTLRVSRRRWCGRLWIRWLGCFAGGLAGIHGSE